MASDSFSNMDESLSEADGHETAAQNGQTVAIWVFGGLVLAGFFFGIVTGYDSPKTIVVTRKEKDRDTARVETVKPAPKVTPNPEVNPTPKDEPKKEEPKKETPKVDTPPKKEPPKKEEPKKEEPKKETPVAVALKEPGRTVAFKEVLPVLRTHCLNCHGGSTGKPKGDVNLTTIAKILGGKGETGALLVPGQPDKSDIYTSITKRGMPEDKPKPSEKELNLLHDWILTGAVMEAKTGTSPEIVGVPPKKEPPAVVKAVSFEKDVKPILRSYCFDCHGGGGGKAKGDVDLTTLAKITAKGGPDILRPGDPNKSALFKVIEDKSMPPKGSGPGKGETEVIKNWILAGAKP